MSDDSLDDLSLFDLFRMDAEEQIALLGDKLVALGAGASSPATLQALMRGAHSFKGAARVVGLDGAVRLTHALEERFVAAIGGREIAPAEIVGLLRCVDLLRDLLGQTEAAVHAWLGAHEPQIGELIGELIGHLTAEPDAATSTFEETAAEELGQAFLETQDASAPAHDHPSGDVNLRITTQHFDRILSMASDGLVQAQQMVRLHDSMQRASRNLSTAMRRITAMANARRAVSAEERERLRPVQQMMREAMEAHSSMQRSLEEMDAAAYAQERKATRLHHEVLQARLRPLADILPSLRRLVHDIALELGKQVRLEITGDHTEVDRDILERLRAPMEHLFRNALDHGLESLAEREASGKPPLGTIRLRARHENGRLAITLEDDGRGIDAAAIRNSAVRKGLVPAEVAEHLTEREALEFLFLPGFSTRTVVTEISGRGFGLDVVQSMVHEAGGAVRIRSTLGSGTSFEIALPVTRSVMRVMRIEAEEEVYAVPMTRIARVAAEEPQRQPDESWTVAGHAGPVPVLRLTDALGGGTPLPHGRLLLLFLLDDKGDEAPLALAVDRLIGATVVAVQQLDERLGKLPGIAAVTLTETDTPMLILDTSEVLSSGMAASQRRASRPEEDSRHAAVLVVDDSHTVRQMLRRTLARARYRVSVAQHGAEAWSMLQLTPFDLLVSDVDMPEMNGIELVEHVRASSRLEHLPIILLSYKNREDDRRRGLDAGADAYVTKGEFSETSFLQVVTDLIGAAEPLDCLPLPPLESPC